MSRSPCLSNSQILRILHGPISSSEAAHAEDHLDRCATCLSVLVALVEVVPREELPGQKSSSSEDFDT